MGRKEHLHKLPLSFEEIIKRVNVPKQEEKKKRKKLVKKEEEKKG